MCFGFALNKGLPDHLGSPCCCGPFPSSLSLGVIGSFSLFDPRRIYFIDSILIFWPDYAAPSVEAVVLGEGKAV